MKNPRQSVLSRSLVLMSSFDPLRFDVVLGMSCCWQLQVEGLATLVALRSPRDVRHALRRWSDRATSSPVPVDLVVTKGPEMCVNCSARCPCRYHLPRAAQSGRPAPPCGSRWGAVGTFGIHAFSSSQYRSPLWQLLLRRLPRSLAGVSPTRAGSSGFGRAAAKSAGALERRKLCSRRRRASHRYIRKELSALPNRMGTDAA
jgi:hypothetical protein